MSIKKKNHIVFDSTNHSYTNTNTDSKYTSVTSLIKKYTPFFDADKISSRIALRDGVDPLYVKAQWKESANRGTYLHSILEDYIQLNVVKEGYEELINAVSQILPYSDLISEDIVYNDECQVAGQVDVYRTDSAIDVYDFKSNKEIARKGFNGEKMLGVLQHLDNCNYNVYSLQLSVYAMILSKELGLPVRHLGIIHITETTAIKIETPFLYEESRMILNNQYLSIKNN